MLGVVVPALNEASALPALLQDLRAQRGIDLDIVVADGGSQDATPERVAAAGARLVRSARGRGRQMNAGARAVRGPQLLFLHADSRLDDPELLASALAALQVAQVQGGHVRIAGHFALRFERAQPGHEFLFRYLEGKTRLNRPYTINGDQGLLLSRSYFEALGGFDESLPFFEDQRLAARIFANGEWRLLPGTLRTSARRFETEGHRQRLLLIALMMGLHAAGVGEFFAQAPQVYAAQHEAKPLRLGPFLDLIRRLLRARGTRGTAAVFLRAGRFVRENAWQLAYQRDQRRNDGHLRALARFDRHIAPLIDHAAGDALAGLLTALWFYGWLPWAERQQL